MKIFTLRFVIALSASVSLGALYLLFLTYFFPVLREPLGIIEIAVFYTLAARVLALLLVPRLRRIHSIAKMVIYSLEMFLVFGAIIAFSLTGNPGLFALFSGVFLSWIAASFFILLPYFILEFGAGLQKGERLLPALTWGVLLLADSLYAANLALGTRSLPPSLVSLGSEMISSAARQPGLPSLGIFSNLVVGGAGVLFYVSLIAYVVASGVEHTGYQGKYTFALIMMLVGNAALLGWILLLVQVTTNMLWILSVPCVSFPLFLLVGFRGRKE